MNEDWKASIAKIVYWKQMIHDLDELEAFPWHFPRTAATGEQIARAEDHMKARFSKSYRDFLSLADGWEGFCITTNLFGTPEFLDGKADEVRGRLDVQDYLLSVGISDSYVVPIGAAEFDTDVFLLISEESGGLAGEVIWIAGEEVDRFPDFRDFFEAMINYNARIAQNLANAGAS